MVRDRGGPGRLEEGSDIHAITLGDASRVGQPSLGDPWADVAWCGGLRRTLDPVVSTLGTDDLTPTALGWPRDDSGSFLPGYAELEIAKKNPCATIDHRPST